MGDPTNKILIVYKSSTGFTKKYAEMTAEEIDCTLADYKTVTADTMSKYNIVVFGTRAHAGTVDGYKKIKQNFQKSKAAHLVLFVTGATPNAEETIIRDFWKQNLSPGELRRLPHFYMQSGLRYENMCFSDKLMLKAASAFLKKKKEKTAFDKTFEQAISGSYDISSKEYIRPLISCLKELN